MTSERYEFDQDLSRAATPPSSWYLDPEMLVREKEKIFGKTWQLVGHTDQVREPGDYFTCTVSEEPLVVARGADGVVRAFSNVCRHRAGPVARGGGSRKSLQCAYHGWTYGMDGALLRTSLCPWATSARLPASSGLCPRSTARVWRRSSPAPWRSATRCSRRTHHFHGLLSRFLQ